MRVIFRSFAIQGSWNYETLIGTGFAYTLLPALRWLYGGEGDRLNAAVARHAELFNSHPYFATVAVGAVTKLEADGVEPLVIHRFKNALRGSLGSLGDRLIWSTWRPMAALAGLALWLAGATWWVAVAAFLVIYNALHIAIRIVGLRIGSDAGLEVGRLLRDAPIEGIVLRASQLGGVLAGFAVVLMTAPGVGDPVATATGVAAAAVGLWLGVHSRRAAVTMLAGFALVSLFLGLAGYGV